MFYYLHFIHIYMHTKYLGFYIIIINFFITSGGEEVEPWFSFMVEYDSVA